MYVRTGGTRKKIIHIFVHLVVYFFSVQHWTLVHNFLVIFWFQTERESEKNEKDIWAKTDKQEQLKPHDKHNRLFSFFLSFFSLVSLLVPGKSHIRHRMIKKRLAYPW